MDEQKPEGQCDICKMQFFLDEMMPTPKDGICMGCWNRLQFQIQKFEPTPKPMTIVMDGGLIQDILNIPEGLKIKIKDYDCEEEKEGPNDCGHLVSKDEDGNLFYDLEWN